MNQFCVDHPGAVISVLSLAGIVIGGLLTIIGYFINDKLKKVYTIDEKLETRNKEVQDKLDKAIEAHASCQATLHEKFAKASDLAIIFNKLDSFRDSMTEFISQLHTTFRTKKEAEKDWAALEHRLNNIEASLNRVENTLIGVK